MSTFEPAVLTAAHTLPIVEEMDPDLFALTLLGGDDEPTVEIHGTPDELNAFLSALRASMRAASL